MHQLDPEHIASLRGRLEHARAALFVQLAGELDVQAGALGAPLRELEASPADNASNRTLSELAQGTVEHTARQLKLVRHALAKLEDGEYGLCEQCGGPIGYSRLQARPEARLCIVCQTRAERPPR